jgi:hypothetical protein
VAIAVVRVNAAAPVISVHPQSAGYNMGDSAEELIVAAESPDEGTLSYQWQSRAGLSGQWTPITGATEASYTPPTTALGTVYYRVEVTNTNTAVTIDGNTSTTTRSREARIMIDQGALNLDIWVNDDRSLVSNMPADLRISKGLKASLAIKAADDLTDLQWSMNGADLAGPRGAAQTIAIEAANYGVGLYTLGLRAVKDGAPYSINITFSVVN